MLKMLNVISLGPRTRGKRAHIPSGKPHLVHHSQDTKNLKQRENFQVSREKRHYLLKEKEN